MAQPPRPQSSRRAPPPPPRATTRATAPKPDARPTSPQPQPAAQRPASPPSPAQTRPPVAEPPSAAPSPQPTAQPAPANAPNSEIAERLKGATALTAPGIDVEADAGGGLENVEQRYLTIPTLVLLQSNHPQTKKTDPQYIEGADEGLFLNTATGELFEKVAFVPCRFQPDYTEWEPGGITGKMVRRWGLDSTGFDECTFEEIEGRSRFTHPNGNEFTERAMFYGLILKMDENTGQIAFEPVVARLGGTSFKVAKRWLTAMSSVRLTSERTGRKFQAPMWYRSVICEHAREAKGNRSWVSWRIAPYADTLSLPDGAEIYQAAKAFAHQIDRGEARAAEDDEPRVLPDDNVPF